MHDTWDEDCYLAAYPDVVELIAAGRYACGRDHFAAVGQEEGRYHPTVPPSSWRERAYLMAYPDVAIAVKRGDFASGYAHFIAYGRVEERNCPFPIPRDWDEEAYLSRHSDVAAALADGYIADGYEHYLAFGKAEGRSIGISSWIKSTLRDLSKFDPAIFPSRYVLASIESTMLEPEIYLGRVWACFLELRGTGAFTHVFVLPWLKRGGSDLISIKLINTLVNSFEAKILVILTEAVDSPWLSRLSPKVKSLSIGECAERLSENDRAMFLARILLESRTRVVHVINSKLGWNTLNAHARSLSVHMRIYVCVFAFQITPEGERAGFARDLESVFIHLSGVITDNQQIIETLGLIYGFDLKRFTCLEFPVEHCVRFLPERSAERKILWASRLDREKNPDVLLAIAKRLPDIKFEVYGNSMLDSGVTMSGIIDELKIQPNVTMFGSFDGFDSIPDRGYFLFLYTTASDGLPNVVLEALGAGLPVLTADVGGIREVVPYESGFLVTMANDIDSFVSKINDAVANPDILARESERTSRLISSRRSQSAFIEQLSRLSTYSTPS